MTKPPSGQIDLFAKDAAAPDGLRYVPDFITAAEETALVQHIKLLPLAPFQFGQYEGKRRVVYFGHSYDFTHQKLEEADPIPDWLQPIARRAEVLQGFPRGSIAHALVTEYEVGAGIGWHRDKKQFGTVIGLSLLSPCPFRFRRKNGPSWQRFTMQADARSLYVMEGEARDVWEHSIAPVDQLRYSITFRTMR